jgi:hypothetical protein
MRNKVFAAFLCVMVCGISKADPILAADCTITASLCSYTPSAVGGLQLSVSDIHGAVSSYTVSDVSSASHSVTFYDPLDTTFAVATSSATVVAGYDGIHGSSSITTTGTGCCDSGDAEFSGDIYDRFQILGSLPAGAQLEFTYGFDILSDAAPGRNNYSAFLTLNSNVCELTGPGLYGNLSKTCTSFVGIGGGLADLDLSFGTDLSGAGPATVYLDATNTAKIDSVSVVDSSGNPIAGV